MKVSYWTLVILLFISINVNAGEFRDYPAKVIRIVDGDTIVVIIDMGFGISLEEKVRLLDYDAPETWRPTDDEEKQLGLKAKEFLRDLILDKIIILKVPTKERGKYGRILALIFVGSIDVNETMKFKGFVKKEEWK